MNRVIKTAIEFAHSYNESCVEDGFGVEKVKESIPVWDNLTDSEKMNALEYVYNNEHDEDFGNSQFCTAIHQAAAYYCVCLLKEQEAGDHFDDIDFMMEPSTRSNQEIQKLFGIRSDF